MQGYITQVIEGEGFHCFVPLATTYTLEKRAIESCEVYIHDGRQLSPVQRNKVFALVADIADWVNGFDAKRRMFNETLREMQLCYLIDCSAEHVRRQLTDSYCRLMEIDLFSLAERSPDTVDMTTARDFIDWLVELCVENGIPCQDTLLNRCENIGRYLYACVINRKCAICGKKADIHEYDVVGMGRNRRRIHHLGQRVIPLCRAHHAEAESIGKDSFDKKYHVSWVVLDEYACEKLKWKK